MADQTILQETLDDNIVDGDWLIYWKTSTGVQRRVARSSLLGATLTGAGTIATGGFTLTVPATGTAALKTGTPVANNVAQWDNANTVEDAGFAASDVALLGGRSGGQSLNGGTAANDDLTLQGTTNATRTTSYVNIQPNGGNVGVGTATPMGPLEVFKANPGGLGGHIILNNSGNAVGDETGLIFNDSGVGSASSIRAAISSTVESSGPFHGDIKFKTGLGTYANLTTRMIISPDGKVGIGTTSPGEKLQIADFSSNASHYLYIASAGGSAYKAGVKFRNFSDNFGFTIEATDVLPEGFNVIRHQSSAAGTSALWINRSNGDVGIGTTTPSQKLHVDGGARISNLTSGTVYSDANGVLNNSASDARIKRDVQAIEADDALAIVDALRPVRYRWNEEYAPSLGEQVEVGLIAQEVQAHVPEVIGTNRDGMLSLEYARLTALLIGAVQALTARVAALEAAAAA